MTNHDPETGIAYGIIPQNDVMPECLDNAEYNYGKPEDYDLECPECGEMLSWDEPLNWGEIVECSACSEDVELEIPCEAEANSFSIERDGYALQGECGSFTSSFDLWVFKSPYYTIAKCSPCAPGAGYLKPVDAEEIIKGYGSLAQGIMKLRAHNSMGDGEKTYCLGAEWFEGEKAPYPVFSVETGERIETQRGEA